MISIKITGLLDMRVLKKWNRSVELRDAFWEQNSTQGWLTFEGVRSGLAKIGQGLGREEIAQYLKQVHRF